MSSLEQRIGMDILFDRIEKIADWLDLREAKKLYREGMDYTAKETEAILGSLKTKKMGKKILVDVPKRDLKWVGEAFGVPAKDIYGSTVVRGGAAAGEAKTGMKLGEWIKAHRRGLAWTGVGLAGAGLGGYGLYRLLNRNKSQVQG